MEASVPVATFDSAYESRWPPWVIGEPQPAVLDLERDGGIRGHVLDPGCGTGEHTIYLTRLGYHVLGVDFSQRAVDLARANAAEHGVEAHFEVADALRLGETPRFDTVVDSALFHVFGPDDQRAYARGLHVACRPGALVYVLALSDTEPGLGPRISDNAIREAFHTDSGWELEEIRASQYRVIPGAEDAARFGLEAGAAYDTAAWLARARRLQN